MNRVAVQYPKEKAGELLQLVEDKKLQVAKYTSESKIKRRVSSFNEKRLIKKKHLKSDITPMELAVALEKGWIDEEAVSEEIASRYKTIRDTLEAK